MDKHQAQVDAVWKALDALRKAANGVDNDNARNALQDLFGDDLEGAIEGVLEIAADEITAEQWRNQ